MNTNNLSMEMKRANVSRKQIAHALGICKHSVDNRFTGKSEFTVAELIEIRDKFFPYCTLDYLAGRIPIFYDMGEDMACKPSGSGRSSRTTTSRREMGR